MKTFNQFQLDSQQLDEGIGTIAKVAIKGAAKFAKKGGLKKIGKMFKKAPKRTIDPYFANKAVEREEQWFVVFMDSQQKILQSIKKVVYLLQYQV